MKLVKERYCIASKSFPLMFYEEGTEYDDIEDLVLFMNEKACEDELNRYNDPEECQILKVKVTYEF